mgnify:CR=1 FL=1
MRWTQEKKIKELNLNTNLKIENYDKKRNGGTDCQKHRHQCRRSDGGDWFVQGTYQGYRADRWTITGQRTWDIHQEDKTGKGMLQPA